MMKTRYAVWSTGRTYRWLWAAALMTGLDAARRYYRIAHVVRSEGLSWPGN